MTSTPYVSTKKTAQAGIYSMCFNTPLASLAAADFVTSLIIPHAFKVIDLKAMPTVAATTPTRYATLTAYIGATAVPGAVLALTSANQTPIGKVTVATATDLAPNGANYGAAGAAISITGSSVSAFGEGSATIILTLQNLEDA